MKTKSTLIVVTDAGHIKLFSTADRGATVTTVNGAIDAMPNPPSREHTSDRPGRSQESIGNRRSAMEPRTDPHQKAEAQFAKLVAERLEAFADDESYKDIIVFAPPIFLGELRKGLSSKVAAKISQEIHKDLTKSPTEDVRAHVRTALFPDA